VGVKVRPDRKEARRMRKALAISMVAGAVV